MPGAGRLRLGSLDPTLPIAALVTLVAAVATVRVGPSPALAALAVAALFVGLVLAFMAAPHVAVAGTILMFTLVPTAKVVLVPAIGGIKDVAALAAIVAAALIGLSRRRAPDRWVGGLVLALLALYVIDAEGDHGVAWLQGVRLVGEPLLLLLAGLTLPEPRRTLRWAVWTLIVAGCAVAVYGVLQQAIGAPRLVGLGYQYNVQVRFVNGHLRSFGTFDDPFAYAAFLLMALAALLFGTRRTAWTSLAAAILFAGLVAALVRTGAVVGVALIGMVAVRRGLATSGAMLTAAAVVVALVLLVTQARGSESRAIPVSITPAGAPTFSTNPGTANVILNGRVSAWKAAVGDQPLQWIFGRGVGTVGTAAARAGYTFVPSADGVRRTTTAVDSGYLATVADVGIVGLLVLLMVLGRLWLLGTRAVRAGIGAGWLALGVLGTLLLDALTRASFTGFPTAFLALLFIGIALAAAREEEERRPPVSPRARGRAPRARAPMLPARSA